MNFIITEKGKHDIDSTNGSLEYLAEFLVDKGANSTVFSCWGKLQSRIELLEKVVKRQGEAIDFYASKDNWARSNKTHFTRINCFDVEIFPEKKGYTRLGFYYGGPEIGGKLARQVKQECEEMMKEKP